MAITASDVLFAKQAPQALAEKLGNGVTADEAFFMEQNPYPVAEKLGVSVDTVFFAESGSAEFANALSSLSTKSKGISGNAGGGSSSSDTEGSIENS